MGAYQNENNESSIVDPENEVLIISVWNRLISFYDVSKENKELIVGPAFTLIPQLFSFPYFIVSLIFLCQENWNKSLTLSCNYLILHIIYSSFDNIYSSSFYTEEWKVTKISKWIYQLWQSSSIRINRK